MERTWNFFEVGACIKKDGFTKSLEVIAITFLTIQIIYEMRDCVPGHRSSMDPVFWSGFLEDVPFQIYRRDHLSFGSTCWTTEENLVLLLIISDLARDPVQVFLVNLYSGATTHVVTGLSSQTFHFSRPIFNNFSHFQPQ